MRAAAFAVLPLLVGLCAAGPAQARIAKPPPMVTGISRTDVVTLFTGMGMRVDDRTPQDGLPWMVITDEGDRAFNVNLYECGSSTPGRSDPCSQVQFSIQWKNANAITLETVNAFNRKYVFGKAYLSEDGQHAGVEYPLHLVGGSSRDMIRENVKYFLRVADDFLREAKP